MDISTVTAAGLDAMALPQVERVCKRTADVLAGTASRQDAIAEAEQTSYWFARLEGPDSGSCPADRDSSRGQWGEAVAIAVAILQHYPGIPRGVDATWGSRSAAFADAGWVEAAQKARP